MKNLLIVMFLVLIQIFSLRANENIDMPLVNFVEKVSQQNNINIYIDEDLKDKKISILIPDKISNNDLFLLFKTTVSKIDFNLKKVGLSYYLSKKLKYIDRNYFYKLKYNSSLDCKSVLDILKVQYKYLPDTNAFLITSTKNKYDEIISFLKSVDNKQKQVILKIMILEFSEDDVKERGVQFASIYQAPSGAVDIALNTIVAPLHTSNNFIFNSDFYGAIRLLNEEKIIKVKQYPFVIAKNNKKFVFEAVENIPYLVQNTKTEASNTSEQNSIEYKDVGLKIYGTTFIYDNYITLDLDLYIEDLLSSSSTSSTPKTSKRHLNSNTDVQFNKVLILGGIKRTKYTKTNIELPFISNIPYLGEIFKYSYDSNSKLNVTIAIEVIKSDEYASSLEILEDY